VRLRSRLALREEAPRRMFEVGSVVLDLDRRTAAREGDDIGLTPFEFNILAWLVERPGRAVSRRTLAESTLTEESGATDRTVDSHVSRIRKKLGRDGSCIATVWGIGYRYDPSGERK
jgi:two-component system, OmpR family, response regulator